MEKKMQTELRPSYTVIGLTIYMATCTQCYTKMIFCIWPDQRLEIAYHTTSLQCHRYAHTCAKGYYV